MDQVELTFTADRMYSKQPRGFTLIELLVVITIIGILSAIGLVAYSSFLKKSRDGKRQSDLKFIQSALEEYHSDQIHYPLLGSGTTCPTTADGKFRVGCVLTNPDGTKTYLTKVPTDPTANSNYSYVPSGTGCADTTPQKCTGYCLYANLEGTAPGSDSGCTTHPGYNYGVTRP